MSGSRDGGRERRRSGPNLASALAAAIVVLAVAGIAVAFAAVPRHPAAAALGATPTPTPTASASLTTGACALAQLQLIVQDAAPVPEAWLEPVAVTNSGAPCVLPVPAVRVAGAPVRDAWGTLSGSATLPAGVSQLYLLMPLCAAQSERDLQSTHPQFPDVTLHLGDATRLIGVFPASSCGSIALGQNGGGEVWPANKLVLLTEQYAPELLAGYRPAPKPPYSPPPAPSPTPTPPRPSMGCTARQLTMHDGVPGALAGSWGDPVTVVNSSKGCLLPPTSISVGRFVARPAADIAVPHGSSTFLVDAVNECPDQRSANIPDHRSDSQPIRLRIGRDARVIGWFPRLTCEGPSIWK